MVLVCIAMLLIIMCFKFQQFQENKLKETDEFPKCVLLGVRNSLGYCLLAGFPKCSHYIETDQLEYQEAGALQEPVVLLPVEQTS